MATACNKSPMRTMQRAPRGWVKRRCCARGNEGSDRQSKDEQSGLQSRVAGGTVQEHKQLEQHPELIECHDQRRDGSVAQASDAQESKIEKRQLSQERGSSPADGGEPSSEGSDTFSWCSRLQLQTHQGCLPSG